MTDENALMFQVQQGHLDGLAELFERNHLALYNYFLRTGSSRAISEDLVQETFMKVLAYRSSFKGTASFRSWLYGIARNTRADYYRKLRGAQHHMNIDDMDHEMDGQQQSLNEQMENAEQQQLFARSLAALPAEQRDLIVLSRYQQLNYQDIADMLNCNLNTLKARMRKALACLQQNYQRLSGELG